MRLRYAFAIAAFLSPLGACASVDLPDVEFMGESDFEQDIAQLERSFPRVDETQAIPTDVRTAQDWDVTARRMLELYDLDDAPESVPPLDPAEFDRRFQSAKAAASAYKADDPQ
ncbi:hypothetical protein [uncultured Algimonas sp.]|uniref:hypothetical protein n=1 Tax=uncultured Algimonas sp. TaxID=1547920 RepID=UPI002631E7C4|nr:hypothetical protein [uncultured Algimonas sp.]